MNIDRALRTLTVLALAWIIWQLPSLRPQQSTAAPSPEYEYRIDVARITADHEVVYGTKGWEIVQHLSLSEEKFLQPDTRFFLLRRRVK